MRVARFLGGLLAATVAIGSGLLAIIAVSPVALVICLLALILFFITASSSRSRPMPATKHDALAAAPIRPQRTTIPDKEKLRRLAAKLGVEAKPDPVQPLVKNEAAAREAMRDIFRGVKKGG